MKLKSTIATLAGLVISASAMAATPSSYDTKFNVSANVPTGVYISDPDGNPVTEVDVVLTAQPSGFMEAVTDQLRLRNNDPTGVKVSMILDDSLASTGSPFALWSNAGGSLKSMKYTIQAMTTAASSATFTNSGDSSDFTLSNVQSGFADEPVQFKFVSVDKSLDIAKGYYTGVVYANVNAAP
ncbi:hypothetical protein FEM41_15215 [Jejubacter calystegiae]|uniref:Uncharacterized protein n=1 Tax=Jejubacter calystegiae TaxID=2579935 RepID=A0A4P8YLZ9_9ENTR|nr:hypothetical protein [Jejubacter calystegiae]QCT20898.1 hypothetical protein FEM41_15215 [Jejubacter calystegiae]